MLVLVEAFWLSVAVQYFILVPISEIVYHFQVGNHDRSIFFINAYDREVAGIVPSPECHFQITKVP